MATQITLQNDPDRWKSMHDEWLREHKPGWLVIGNKTYRVLHLKDDNLVFEEQSGEEFYESRSF